MNRMFNRRQDPSVSRGGSLAGVPFSCFGFDPASLAGVAASGLAFELSPASDVRPPGLLQDRRPEDFQRAILHLFRRQVLQPASSRGRGAAVAAR